ncbi:hypothetical protein EJB05_32217 [Eragrostis curvula]|uniref:DRBM domain-containing protein n=1 Tax=Eragrostis curvula TaxID=38414 RepID=A0A5J9UGY5_9POAL|nr:hypothetical protein EJB05_32217 [Eragrostis curvula]
MHKSRLMELSQRQRWPSPSYTFTRDGPDHAPLFRATIVVDGAEFCSPGGGSRTAKEAVNLAAKAALENLSQFPGVPPPTKSENQLNHKNQLQIYAQKRGIQPPSYCPIPIGSPHEPLFKSKVIIDGQTFESPKEYRTLKAAEKAAAGLALTSLPQEASLQDQSTLPSIPYKNLLQELAQKEHCPLPCYKTMPNILDNTATFISTVEIRGEIFEGEPGSTKKQAEMNAAKAAFQNFEERRKRSDSSTPVLGGSYMQNELSMQSAGQEIQSGKPGPLVPEISTVSCNKANDSDASELLATFIEHLSLISPSHVLA